MPKNNKPNLNVIFLGGVDGIGMNITAFEYGNDIIAVDCGVAFPEDDMLGIDLVIPDFTYLEKNVDRLRALLITHGHEDHIGAVPYFLKKFQGVPVYATRLTLGIIDGKLAEHNIKNAKLQEVKAGQTVNIGVFECEYINVNHSMPDSCAICIDTPCGRVLHTGDFKVDYTPVGEKPIDLARLSELGRKGIRLLLCDSTNAERPGYTPSESSLAVSFDRIFHGEKRRIVIATFSSNVHRVQQIINAAHKAGRKVAVTGRSMQNFVDAAVRLHYLTVPENTMIDIADIKFYPPEKITIVTTGSQGEPMSALYRMAFGDHSQVSLGSSDLVVLSSSAIPGNEKFITKIINALYKCGAEVITYSNYDVHVSGHACREELKLMHTLTKPEFFVPVHGEYKHLIAHIGLARELGMPDNKMLIPEVGGVIELTRRQIRHNGSVEAGTVMVAGSDSNGVNGVVLRDRKRLAEDGVMIVTAGVDPEYGCVSAMPEITTRGFIYEKDNGDLLNKLEEIAYNSLVKWLSKDVTDLSVLKTHLREDLAEYTKKRTKCKPMIVVALMDVRR